MHDHAVRDLGDGLILRRATPADADALAAFNGGIHRGPTTTEPDAGVAGWTRDLLTRPHPTFAPNDFTIVEDTRARTIVSSLNLISQTWDYDGVLFGVGRPELVGTNPHYRRRGLVRAQFDVIHQWSVERGHRVQAITGIPWYYRQFGYEMAIDLDAARTGYAGYSGDVPRLKDGESEPYRFRPATVEDVPFLAEVYRAATRRSLISCPRDERLWRYEVAGRSSDSGCFFEWRVIETTDAEAVGYLAFRPVRSDGDLAVTACELRPAISWSAVGPSIMRFLRTTVATAIASQESVEPGLLVFRLGADHPLYHAEPRCMPRIVRPYAWYVRVADVPGFIQLITPVLEKRLAESIVVGHTGEIKLSFYRSGVRLLIDKGRIRNVEPWSPGQAEPTTARFPDLTFLQLLFGYRSLSELEYAFPDCRATSDAARVVVNALFPKKPSNVWGIE